MLKVHPNLFKLPKDMWAPNRRDYNRRLDELKVEIDRDYSSQEWELTLGYVNDFAEMNQDFGELNSYPKITFNSLIVAKRIKRELGIELFPALFVYTGPVKDAGEFSWWMHDKNRQMWSSADHLYDFLRKKNKIEVPEHRHEFIIISGEKNDKRTRVHADD